MTSKKRARNRNKNKNATEKEKRSTPKTTTLTTTATNSSPDEIKEDADMCVHGLNLQYTNEAFKQTIKDLCDDAASDIEKVQRVLYGNVPRGVRDCQVPYSALIDDRMKFLVNLAYHKDDVSEKDVPTDSGITFILAFKFPEFAEDSVHIKWIISHFLSEGTKCLLRGDVQTARGNAYFANFFEQTLNFMDNEKMINGPKLLRLHSADEHTLCSYLRNRIPCSCLDEKYKEVKSVIKKDMCWNIECKQPNRFEVDSKSMMICSRCRQACYCSCECQEMDWRARHKMNCVLNRDVREMFTAKDRATLDNNPLWKDTISPHLSKYLDLDS